MATTTHSSIYISRPSNYEGDGTDDKEEFIETCNIRFKDMFKEALLHKPICKGFFSDIIFK
ncbi:hypothetical protein DBQ26_09840 [Acinetobacter pittii]|nr:hypothetical protein DBQ26_09840 [Acinetobacter pittii]